MPDVMSAVMGENPFRNLPSVNDVLAAAPVQALAGSHAHDAIVTAIRAELGELRNRLGRGEAIRGQGAAEVVAGRRAPPGRPRGAGGPARAGHPARLVPAPNPPP